MYEGGQDQGVRNPWPMKSAGVAVEPRESQRGRVPEPSVWETGAERGRQDSEAQVDKVHGETGRLINLDFSI